MTGCPFSKSSLFLCFLLIVRSQCSLRHFLHTLIDGGLEGLAGDITKAQDQTGAEFDARVGDRLGHLLIDPGFGPDQFPGDHADKSAAHVRVRLDFRITVA